MPSTAAASTKVGTSSKKAQDSGGRLPAKGGAEDLGIRRGQTEIIGQHVVWFAKRSFAPPVSRRWREIIPSTQNRPPDGPG